MSLLDKIRGNFAADKLPHEVPKAHDTIVEPHDGAGFDTTQNADSSLAGLATETADPTLLSRRVTTRKQEPGALFGRHRQRVLIGLIVLGLAGMAAWISMALISSNRCAAQVRAVGQALMHSQRMAKSMLAVNTRNSAAFAELRESVGTLSDVINHLRTGDGELAAAPAHVQPTLNQLQPLIERAEKNAKVVQAQEMILTQVHQALQTINSQSDELLESAEAVSALTLQVGASTGEISAASQLVMLSQRIGKSANELLTQQGVSPSAVFKLGKDLNSFKLITEALISGSPELRLNAVRDPQLKESLQTLLRQYERTRVQGVAILHNLHGMVSAQEAQIAILNDSEPLRKGLEQTAAALESSDGAGIGTMLVMLVSLAALIGGACGSLSLCMRGHVQATQARASARFW